MIIDIIDKVEREKKYLSESLLQFSKLYNETGKRKYGELMEKYQFAIYQLHWISDLLREEQAKIR